MLFLFLYFLFAACAPWADLQSETMPWLQQRTVLTGFWHDIKLETMCRWNLTSPNTCRHVDVWTPWVLVGQTTSLFRSQPFTCTPVKFRGCIWHSCETIAVTQICPQTIFLFSGSPPGGPDKKNKKTTLLSYEIGVRCHEKMADYSAEKTCHHTNQPDYCSGSGLKKVENHCSCWLFYRMH